MTLPPPLTDPDADLTSFKDMPFEVVRFRQSDLIAMASAEGVIAAIMLWGASWHSRPAGSLTDDDRALAKAAGYGRAMDAWLAVRDDALRGWIKCSDGRLYHPVVAEKVRESWLSRLKHKHRTYAAAIRQHNGRNEDDQRPTIPFDDWLECGRPEGVKREPRKPVQTALDLESDTDDDESRVTDANVTRDKGSSHANQTPESREKNVQGKGREGKGREGIYIPSSTGERSDAPSRVEDDDSTWDLLGITNRLAKLGGVSIITPSARARAMDTVKAWLADGIDVERDLVPVIESAAVNAPSDGVGSLAYFDRPLRTKLAKVGKRSASAKPTGPPPKPMTETDDDDPRVAAIRQAIVKRCGHRLAEHWFDPKGTAIKLNGASLTIKSRTDFNTQWIKDNYQAILTEIVGEVAGMSDVRIVTA